MRLGIAAGAWTVVVGSWLDGSALVSQFKATIADGQGIGTIANDDSVGTAPPQVSVSDVSVDEGNNGNQSATFTISLPLASATSLAS